MRRFYSHAYFCVTTLLFLVAQIFLLFPARSIISDNENALDLLGQYDQTNFANPIPVYTKGGANDGANIFGFDHSEAVTIDTTHHRLFIADKLNNRVLVYNLNADNTFTDRVPDNVLGQTDFYSNTGALTQSQMTSPYDVTYDSSSNNLFVADYQNNRVLVYDVTSISNGENATHVLGQADFTSSTAGTTQTGISHPSGLTLNTTNHTLFVSDTSNNRVLVYDITSITDGMNASYVLGQSSFTVGTAGTTQTTLRDPGKISYDSTDNSLFVADASNNRVLVYDVTSISNGENATHVLGQADFTSSTAATTQASMKLPSGVATDMSGRRLFVSDTNNNRVLVYDITSITDGMNASYVLGQSSFTVGTAGSATQSRTGKSTGITYDSSTSRLFAAEPNSSRVLIFNVASITNGMNAADLLGQYNETSFTDPVPVYTKAVANNGTNTFGLNTPAGEAVDIVHHRLFVSDYSNNRVLVYNLSANNTLSSHAPSNVLGQANFYTSTAAATQSGMYQPTSLAYDSTNNRLFVADYGHSRVLIFDVSTITNGMNATNVLGQATFTDSSPHLNQSGTKNVEGLTYDETGNRLFVADPINRRVLVFDTSTITNGMNATNVLGQADFTSSTAAVTQAGMRSPVALSYDGTNDRLFITDQGNARVLVFDTSTITNGMNATNVLGQADFTSSTAAVTQSTFSSPAGITYDDANSRLFVADTSVNRILVFRVTTITNGMNATNVLGQADFTSSTAATTQSGMNQPQGICYNSGDNTLLVADVNNNRILSFDASAGDVTAPVLQSFTSSTPNGTYGPDSPITITANYDESLNNTSTLTITLTNSISITLDTVSGSAISGTYTIGATGSGEDALTLSVASITSESVSDTNSNTRVDSTIPDSPNNLGDTSTINIDTTASSFSNISATASQTDLIITYTTTNASSTQASYGTTISYGTTTAETDTPVRVTNHTITITSLTCGTTYHIMLSGTDDTNNTSQSSDQIFDTLACPSSESSSGSGDHQSATGLSTEPDTSARAIGNKKLDVRVQATAYPHTFIRVTVLPPVPELMNRITIRIFGHTLRIPQKTKRAFQFLVYTPAKLGKYTYTVNAYYGGSTTLAKKGSIRIIARPTPRPTP